MTEPENKESFRRPLKRPPVLIVQAMLLLLLSTGGFYGGVMLLSDISGGKLGTPLSLLEHLPIGTFLIPGIILLVFMGIIPAITAIGILRKEVFPFFNRFSILKAYTWAYCSSMFTGLFLVGWTLGELILWGASVLSVVYLIWGIFILLIGMTPKVKHYYLLEQV